MGTEVSVHAALQAEMSGQLRFLGSILLYLLQLCDKLQIDLLEAARQKLVVNGEKYPVARAHGSSKKYTDP